MKIIHYILLAVFLGACSDSYHEDDRDLIPLNLQTPVIVTEGSTRARPIEGTTFSYLNTLTYYFNSNTHYSTDYNLSFYVCEQGTFTPHIEGSNNKRTTLNSFYNANTQKNTFYH